MKYLKLKTEYEEVPHNIDIMRFCSHDIQLNRAPNKTVLSEIKEEERMIHSLAMQQVIDTEILDWEDLVYKARIDGYEEISSFLDEPGCRYKTFRKLIRFYIEDPDIAKMWENYEEFYNNFSKELKLGKKEEYLQLPTLKKELEIQKRIASGRGVCLTKLYDYIDEFFSLPWWKRVWKFTEFLLSIQMNILQGLR